MLLMEYPTSRAEDQLIIKIFGGSYVSMLGLGSPQRKAQLGLGGSSLLRKRSKLDGVHRLLERQDID
jgi:hypothetical protein